MHNYIQNKLNTVPKITFGLINISLNTSITIHVLLKYTIQNEDRKVLDLLTTTNN